MINADTCDHVPFPYEHCEKYYSSLFDLSFLALPPESHSERIHTHKRSQTLTASDSSDTHPESRCITPVVEPSLHHKDQIIDPKSSNSADAALSTKHTAQQQTSWYYVRPVFIDKSKELTQNKFKTLLPYIKAHENVSIHCYIFVFDHDEDLPFFHRLTKLLSKQLFPTRIEIISSTSNVNLDALPSLCLVPLSFAKKFTPQASLHQIAVYQHISWLPIYSSFQYEHDPQLRQHLWSILKQQPFAYTPKS